MDQQSVEVGLPLAVSLDVFSRSFAIASAKVDGINYFLLLLRPCCFTMQWSTMSGFMQDLSLM